MNKKVTIVGAGLSGLTAAYRLHRQGCDVTVLEASPSLGGRVQTVSKAGYTFDVGATAIADSYTAYMALADELGLKKAITRTSSITGIVRNNRVYCLDTNNILLSGLRTGIFSLGSKLALLKAFWDVRKAKKAGMLDYTDMGRAAPLDYETAAEYARRRLNPELADFFCDPIVRTMLMANSDKISKVEFFSGLANIFDVSTYGVEGGLNRFAQALAKDLNVRLNCRVTAVRSCSGGVEIKWQENGGTGTAQVDACVVACPLDIATEICADHQQLLGPLNNLLSYTQCISVAVGVKKKPDKELFVLQVPRRESEEIVIMFLEHHKVNDAAPPDHGLIVCYWEEAAASRMMNHPDDDLVGITVDTLIRFFPELAGQVDMTHVTRWQRALPMTRTGTYKAIGEFNRALERSSPVQFAADYMSGAGQNTAVECGNRAAEKLLRQFADTHAS